VTHLNTSIVRAPRNEGDFVSQATISGLVLHIIDGIARALSLLARLVLALRGNELLPERVPVGVARLVLDNNGLPVVGQFVDDVFCVLAQLQFVEVGDALWCDLDTGK